MAISNDWSSSQWVREAIKIKEKSMFASLSINRDTGNLNIDQIHNTLLKNELIVSRGIKTFQNHQGTRLYTRPRRTD